MIYFDLQFFADGALNTQLTTTSGLSPTMKTYYEPKVLRNAQANLVHQQFADTYPIPQGNGKTIEMRRFLALPKALIPITEATMPTGRGMTEETITATVDQYGDYISTSDVLELTAFDPILDVRSELQGNQAGLTMDTITREVLVGGSNTVLAPKVAVADGVTTETAVTARHLLDATAKVTPKLITRAATLLKRENVPKIDGSYIAIMHPDTTQDLLNDANFVKAIQYGRPEDLYEGEIGKYAGVRVVETSEAKIFWGADLTEGSRNLTVKTAITSPAAAEIEVKEAITTAEATAMVGREIILDGEKYEVVSATAGAAGAAKVEIDTAISIAADKVLYPGEGAAAGVAAYATLVLGAGAYGTTDVEGGGLQFIVKPKGYADALDLRSASGWKCLFVAERLDETRIVRLEHCTAMSDIAEAN